jgi:hypothetical protein
MMIVLPLTPTGTIISVMSMLMVTIAEGLLPHPTHYARVVNDHMKWLTSTGNPHKMELIKRAYILSDSLSCYPYVNQLRLRRWLDATELTRLQTDE